MGLSKIAIILCLVAMATAEHGMSSYDYWAFHWYDTEPFSFKYEDPTMNASSPGLRVAWTSPNGVEINAANTLYQLNNVGRIENGELVIKEVSDDVAGVYWCKVTETDSGEMVNRTIFGLNIKGKLYRNMTDKYRRNIIIAFVATAVFIVPLITICLTYRLSYEKRHECKSHKNGGTRAYMDSPEDNYEMKKKQPSDFTDPVRSREGKGAYDNPAASTNL